MAKHPINIVSGKLGIPNEELLLRLSEGEMQCFFQAYGAFLYLFPKELKKNEGYYSGTMLSKCMKDFPFLKEKVEKDMRNQMVKGFSGYQESKFLKVPKEFFSHMQVDPVQGAVLTYLMPNEDGPNGFYIDSTKDDPFLCLKNDSFRGGLAKTLFIEVEEQSSSQNVESVNEDNKARKKETYANKVESYQATVKLLLEMVKGVWNFEGIDHDIDVQKKRIQEMMGFKSTHRLFKGDDTNINKEQFHLAMHDLFPDSKNNFYDLGRIGTVLDEALSLEFPKAPKKRVKRGN